MLPTIGVVAPALPAGGGVPAVASFLCRRIEASGRFRLRVYSVSTSSSDRLSQRLRAPQSWLQSPRSLRGFWDGRRFREYGTRAAELEFMRFQPHKALTRSLRRCDLIQVVAGSPAHALVAAEARAPVALQVATLVRAERAHATQPGSVPLRAWRSLMTQITAQYDDHGLRSVDSVLVENRWMYEHARRTVTPKHTRVSMAYPGVDTDHYSPLAAIRVAQLREAPYILFVGRLSDPRKNLRLLAAAYVKLCRRMKHPPRLVLAGHYELAPEARAELNRLSDQSLIRIVRAPSPAELLDLYQRASCLALSSTEEGFGMVLIEAMACGVPVVATRCGGPEEIVTDSSDGFLVPLDDATALANRLMELVEDLDMNVAMGRFARQTVEQRFSMDAAFAPFLQTYQRLLA